MSLITVATKWKSLKGQPWDDLTKQDDYIIHYISLISNALDYDLFVIAYNKTYPISIQFETLVSSIPNFSDVHQTEYLLQNLNKIISEVDIPPETKSDVIAKKVIFNKKQYDFIHQTLSAYLERHQNTKSSNFPRNVSLALEQYYELTKQFDDSDKIIQDGMPCTSKPNKDEIDLYVKAVLDVLPHLQASFVLECLEKANYNVNDVITDILSNNLSSTLCSPSTSRQKYSNANELLDDKEEKQKIKEFVLKASYTFDLDDEYDDRTEMSTVRNDSSDSESGIYRHLGNYNKITEEDNGSSSEDTPEVPERNTKLDFCTDPAVLRDLRKTQYQNKRKVFPKKTVEETNDKQKHSKSHKPKHNRRGGAEWKRSKGMIPS
ncbi:hypothetical protein FQA39_LY15526 [Lamprigera yunnana]|nr:hypothetical protein FQA39_LY15526 [Lamprigera yunnana]